MPMRKLFAALLLILCLLFSTVTPLFAAEEVPEPFCGDLEAEDCAVLRDSNAAMFNLSSYSTAIEYKVLQHGVPDLPPESEAILRIKGQYAFDQAAQDAMRTL